MEVNFHICHYRRSKSARDACGVRHTEEKMKKEKIWMDCDPGIDDAVALAMAAASRDALDIYGISTVAGNQTLTWVTENARKLTAFLGLTDIPVVSGAPSPLVRSLSVADYIHGETGLGNYRLPETEKTLASDEAVLVLRDCLRNLPEGEKLTLVPTGPLTNLALLLLLYPDVKEKIRRIVLMGGAAAGGNVTSTAEFNIWVDPEAAAVVFGCGISIVMCGLDVTMKCGLTRDQIAALRNSPKPILHAYGEILGFYGDTTEYECGAEVVNIHDAVTLLYLTNPDLFAGIPMEVRVDCTPENRGRTICTHAGSDSRHPAVLLLNQVNLPEFQRTLLAKLESL